MFPFWIVADIQPSKDVRFYGRVRTYNLASCRTDLHDWIGTLWAACLRKLNVASTWLMDEEGFVCEEEIYGRGFVFF
jgi:hypothetical protein